MQRRYLVIVPGTGDQHGAARSSAGGVSAHIAQAGGCAPGIASPPRIAARKCAKAAASSPRGALTLPDRFRHSGSSLLLGHNVQAKLRA